MSGKTVDDRVVQLRFDNSQFESNVRTSMSTLERLKNALKFKNASKGLDSIKNAAKNVNMDALGNSVEKVKHHFSALEVVGVTALANITNSAVNAGKNMIKALTLDPIITGFQEYETKINAVQTIMSNTASKGTTMADVTRTLDDLNKYADLTIYNFAEMTRNIGTFTAAGVGLEDAAGAIKGIANLAAASGSNSYQASTAMYQLSQALAAGSLKLQDWNSVVNAGMGGEKFQNALKETAREMGINVDAMIGSTGNFRESLRDGWITADVLNTTLKKFTREGAAEYSQAMMDAGKWTQEQADALMKEAIMMEDAATKVKTFTQLWDTMKESVQSGWAQSWELIVGDFEEAKASLTELSDVFSTFIQSGADARNAMLETAMSSNWKKLSKEITSLGIDLEEFKGKLIDVGIQHGVVTQEMIDEAGSFEQSLKSGWLTTDIFAEAMQGYKDTAIEFGATTDSMQAKLDEFQGKVAAVWGDQTLGTVEDRIMALEAAGYDFAGAERLVEEALNGHTIALEDLSVAEMEAIGFTQEEAILLSDLGAKALESGTSINELVSGLDQMSGRELVFDTLKNSILAIMKPIQAVRDAWNETFGVKAGDRLLSAIKSINKFSRAIVMSDETADKLRRTMKGVFSVADIGATIVGKALKGGMTALTGFIKGLNLFEGGILTVTAAIGDQITAFHDWALSGDNLNIVMDKIRSTLQKVGGKIKEFAIEFYELPIVQEVLAKFRNMANKVFDVVSQHISECGTNVKEFIESIGGIDNIHLNNIPDILRNFRDNVLKPAFKVDDIGAAFINGFKTLSTNLKQVFTNIGNIVDTVKQKLTSFVNFFKENSNLDITAGSVFAAIAAVGSIVGLVKILDVVDKLLSPLEGLTKLLDKFGDVLGGLNKKLKAEALKANADAIRSLAMALMIISLINPDRMAESIVILLGLATMLVVLAKAFSMMDKAGGMSKASLGMIGLATAVYILSKSMMQLSLLNWDEIGKGMVGIGGLMAMMTGLMAAMGHFKATELKGFTAFIGFAIMIKVLVSALSDVAEMNIEAIGKGLLGIISMMLAFAIAAKAMEGVTGGAGIALIGTALAIKLLVGILKEIAGMDPATIREGVVNLIPVMAMLAALMLATQLAGEYAAKAGVFVLMLSAGLMLIAQAIKTLAGIDEGSIKAASKAIAGIMAVMALVVAASYFAGKHAIKAGVMLLLMSGALIILSGVMLILSKLDPSGLGRATACVMGLMSLFALLMYMSKYTTKSYVTLIVISACIAILAGVLAALTMIEIPNLLAATAAMGTIMGLFALIQKTAPLAEKAVGSLIVMTLCVGLLAGILALMSMLDANASIRNSAAIGILLVSMSAAFKMVGALDSISLKAVGALALMTLVVGMLAALVGTMAYLNIEPSLKTTASLTILITTLSACLALIGVAKTPSWKAIGVLAVMGLVVGEIGAIIGVLQKFDIAPTLETAKSLALMLGTFTAVYAILGVTGEMAPVAMEGVVGLIGVIGFLGTFMAGVGSLLTMVPEIEEFINKAIPALNAVAKGIGEFIGNIVGGFMSGATSGLGDVGAHLTEFMENAMPFFEMAKTLGPETFDGVKNMSESVLELTKSGVLDKLSEVFSGESALESLGPKLSAFADSLVGVSGTAVNINMDGINALADAGTKLGDMENAIPKIGGLKSVMEGYHNWDKFGEDMGSLCDALISVGDKATDIKSENVTKVSEAGKALAGMYEYLPAMGGVIQFFKGEQDLGSFASKLGPLGEGIKAVSAAGAEVDAENVQKITDAVKVLAEVQVMLPDNEFGVNETWIDEFGRMIKKMGDSFKDFVKTFDDVDLAKVPDIVEAVQGFARVAVSLNGISMQGWKDLVTSFDDMGDVEDLGQNLNSLGTAMTQLSDTLANVEVANLQKMVTIQTTLNFLNNVDMAGLAAKFGDWGSITAMSIGLKGFAMSISNMSDIMATVQPENLTKFSGIAGPLNTIAGINITALTTKFSDWGSITAFGMGLRGFVMALSNASLAAADLNPLTIGMIIQSVRAFIPLVDLMPEMSKFSTMFGDTMTLGELGQQAADFGMALSQMCNTLSGVDLTIVPQVTSTMQQIVNMLTMLPQDGLFKKNTSLSDFGAQLSEFGYQFSQFAAAVQGSGDISSLQTIVSQMQSLSNIATQLSAVNLDGMKNFVNNLRDMSTIDLSAFANSISNAAAQIAPAVQSIMQTFSTQIQAGGTQVRAAMQSVINSMVQTASSSNAAMSTAATAAIGSFTSALQNGSKGAQDAIRSVITSMVNGVTSNIVAMEKAGNSLALGLKNGIDRGSKNIDTAFDTVVSNAVTNVNNKYQDFSKAGQHLVDGLAAGIRAKAAAAAQAAAEVASKCAEAARNALKVQSPSRVFMEIGKYTVQGLANGLRDHANISNKAAVNMANGVIDSFKTTLKINSPSIVARDEVGKYIMEGIAEGIEEDMTAEEAAAQKAQNIVQAFQDEMGKFDIHDTTLDLEYQLWENLNPNASDAEKKVKQYELYQKQLQLQAERVTLAQGEYETILAEFGANSEETINAYHTMLQAQIDMAKITKTMNDLLVEANESEYDAAKAYREYLDQVAPKMLELGYSMNQIQEVAQQRTGYYGQMKQTTDGLAATVKNLANAAMQNVSGTYAEFTKSAFGQALTTFGENGRMLANQTAQGLQQATPQAAKAGEEMVNKTTEPAVQAKETFYEAGLNSGAAFADGLKSQVPVAQAAANQIAGVAQQVQNSAKVISKAAISSYGKNSIYNSFDAYSKTLNKGKGTGQNLHYIKGTSVTIESLGSLNYANGVIAEGSDGKTYYKKPGDEKVYSTTSKEMAQSILNTIASGGKLAVDPTYKGETVTNNYNFTQNNTSPKAISASETYRLGNGLLFNKLKTATSSK